MSIWTDKQGRRHVGIMVNGKRVHRVLPQDASASDAKLTKQLCIKGLTFHDSRATALTHMSRKVPVEVLAKVSRHKDVSLLVNTYYRPTVDEIARRL